ncbi:hypothetical protein E5676_scaffold325G00430 [Cucumis melo var. makuwa]|uniref:Uncharacterized protein n=1 Tax=Cucumis melo var. makuwa TaxID=1194695 RepID=A0A5A7TUY0_CUCMM|nr:hypothetical protein E6C27_scaffold30G001860 [Cucumis melo var. makuwa]TYK27367.1 hypothetical protein E5676_scaffold325G00430 [Cucumis melo var. makuwa]
MLASSRDAVIECIYSLNSTVKAPATVISPTAIVISRRGENVRGRHGRLCLEGGCRSCDANLFRKVSEHNENGGGKQIGGGKHNSGNKHNGGSDGYSEKKRAMVIQRRNSNVVLRSDLGDDHIPSLHNLSYQVILPLYMFPSFMAARNFLRQTASFVASQAATYLASIVESAMYPCLMLRHTTTPPFKVNTDPDVDFRFGNQSQCIL